MFDSSFYIQKFNDFMMLRDLTTNTVRSYNSMLRMYLTWCLNQSKSPEEVSFEKVRSYLFFLKDIRKLSNRSVNAHISQIRFLHLFILHRPWSQYEVPFMKFHTKMPEILSIHEVNSFIASISNLKHKAIVALLYSSGIRVSELCHLRYSDVDRKNLRLYISSSKSRCDRYAILSVNALNLLTQYWFSYGKPMEWLFPGRGKQGHIVNFTVSQILTAHAKQLGWKKVPNCHMFRHSFGTHLYEAGCDLLTIQKLLGHKSVDSTTIYVSLGVTTMSLIQSPFDFGETI